MRGSTMATPKVESKLETYLPRIKAARDRWTPEAVKRLRELASPGTGSVWHREMAVEMGCAERSLMRWESGEVEIGRMAGSLLGWFALERLDAHKLDDLLALLEAK